MGGVSGTVLALAGSAACALVAVWVLLVCRRSRCERQRELAARVAEHLRRLTGRPEAGVTYDTVQRRWLAHVPIGQRGCALLPLARRPRDFRGLVHAAYELYADGAPEVVGRPDMARDCEVLWRDRARGWRRWLPCEDCGGYWLALSLDPVFEPVHAQMLAVCRGRPDECLQCETLRIRSGEIPSAPLWYDTVTEQWFTWRDFGEAGGGASWPTGIGGYHPPPVELEPVREALTPRPLAIG